MRTFFRNVIEGIATIVDEAEAGSSRTRRWLAGSIRFCNFGFHQLAEDRAPLLAAALAYRTIFSLIPVLVVSLVVLGSFYGPESFKEPLTRMLDFTGLSDLKLSDAKLTADDDATKDASGDAAQDQTPQGDTAQGDQDSPDDVIEDEGEQEPVTVADWISTLVVRIQSLNFAAISAVGVLILIYAAFSLLFEIERCFNIVYHAERGRRTMVRLTKYWAMLTLGPILLIASFYVGQRITSAAPLTGLRGLSALVTFVISWVLLTMVYTLGPNARVTIRPALIGAFVAGILWEIAKWGFAKYVTLATGYTAFYGSLGLLPVFLLWVYLTWLIILFGLELTYVSQMFPRLEGRGRPQSHRGAAVAEPAFAVVMLKIVAADFAKGDVTSEVDLQEQTGADQSIISRFAQALTKKGLLRVIPDDDGLTFTLARPADSIRLDDALQVGIALTCESDDERSGANDLLTRIHDAERQAIGDLTLADLTSSARSEAS